MNKSDLAALGLTEKDVLEKVADRLCEQLLDDAAGYGSEFRNRVEGTVKKRVDAVLESALKKHIEPNVQKMCDEITLQETNRWGEAKGQKKTFVEYLVERTDAFIREPVNHEGKSRGEDSYNFRESTTRIAYMIDKYLRYEINKAMELALGQVNSSVRKGLEEAVKIALNNIKVEVNTKVTT